MMTPALLGSGISLSRNKHSQKTQSPVGAHAVVTNIPEVPVTVQRKPFTPHDESANDRELYNPGTARVNIAASQQSPNGTTQGGWKEQHRHQTVLQQHCAYFDPDNDGIIWPLDTYHGFHKLGYNILLSAFAMFVIHFGLSYPTTDSLFPDPLLRIFLQNIHKDKHGSDTGTYDNEGRFIPQKFEDMFAKYSTDGEGLTLWEVWNMGKGQRCTFDFFGQTAVVLEWLATYVLLWPEDGVMRKEDIRRVYDGSLFYCIDAERENNRAIK